MRSVAWSDESFKFTLRGGNRLGNRGLLLESVRPEFRQNFWPNTISTSSPPTWARVTLIRPNLPTVFVSPPLSYARAPKHPLNRSLPRRFRRRQRLITRSTSPQNSTNGSVNGDTGRYAWARTLIVGGTAVPPEAEPIEDPQMPGVMTKAGLAPVAAFMVRSHFSFLLQICIKSVISRLMYLYTERYITTSKQEYPTAMTACDSSYSAPADSGAYEAGLTTVGDFDTVESYCRYFNWLKPRSKLERNSDVGGQGERERRQVGTRDEEQPDAVRSVLAVAYKGARR